MTIHALRELTGPLGTFATGDEIVGVPRTLAEAWVRAGVAERRDERPPEKATREAPEKPRPPREAPSDGAPETATAPTLEDLTVPQLRERAEGLGITIPPKARKAELVALIAATEAEE